MTPSASERQAAIDEFGGAGTSANLAARGRALRRVAENGTLNQQEFNRAFVWMQFFGYLRRNPNDPQDSDYTGYDFWLTKLNQFTATSSMLRWSRRSSLRVNTGNASGLKIRVAIKLSGISYEFI